MIMKKTTKILLTGTAIAAGAFAYSILTDPVKEASAPFAQESGDTDYTPRHSTSSAAEWIAHRKQAMKEKAAKTAARKSSRTPALAAGTVDQKALVPVAEGTAEQRKGKIS